MSSVHTLIPAASSDNLDDKLIPIVVHRAHLKPIDFVNAHKNLIIAIHESLDENISKVRHIGITVSGEPNIKRSPRNFRWVDGVNPSALFTVGIRIPLENARLCNTPNEVITTREIGDMIIRG